MKLHTKKTILTAIKKYLAENGMNTKTIRVSNPLPCSTSWLDLLTKSVKNGTHQNFNTSKCIEVLDFLGISWKIEDGELICEN